MSSPSTKSFDPPPRRHWPRLARPPFSLASPWKSIAIPVPSPPRGPDPGARGTPVRRDGRAGLPRPRPAEEAEALPPPRGLVLPGRPVLAPGRGRPRDEGRVHDDAAPRRGGRVREARQGPPGGGRARVLERPLEPPRWIPRVRGTSRRGGEARVRGGARRARPRRPPAPRLPVRLPR